MKSYLYPITALVWKDILLELRTKDTLVSTLVFSLLIIIIFNFALEPIPQIVGFVAPGILWVAILLSGMLGVTRSFALEKDDSNIRGLMLVPVSRDAIFFGKMISSFTLMMLVEVLVFPAFAVLFNIKLLEPLLIPTAILATLGIATLGTLFSAMALNTKAREVMLPLLFLPAAVPILISAVETTTSILTDTRIGDLWVWLPLLAAFDGIFLVICPIAFHLIAEE